jgi:Glycosyltransferases, probably involved in cell wall biogenesis
VRRKLRRKGLNIMPRKNRFFNRIINLKKIKESSVETRLQEIKVAERRRPAFSIVVITYNPEWEKLRATLASIIAQDFQDYEIILTDDGSKNNLFDKVERYFKHFGFNRYTLISHTENRGTVKNLISGVGSANGRFIKDIGPGDMFYSRDTLGKVYRYMTETDSRIAAGYPVGYTNTSKGRRGVTFNHPFDIEAYKTNNEKKIMENLILYTDMFCGANLCYEREFFLNYLRQMEDRIIYAEDLLQIMSAVDGERASLMPFRMVWYEVDTGSSTKKQSPFKVQLSKDVETMYKILSEEHPDNKLLQKRMELQSFYKVKNIYLRTLLRSSKNPGLYPYMMRHYYQSITGKHKPTE